MKKLKKLTLKKEIITDLCKGEMNDLKGGASAGLFGCYESGGLYPGCNSAFCGGGGGDGGYHTVPPRCCAYGCCETVNC